MDDKIGSKAEFWILLLGSCQQRHRHLGQVVEDQEVQVLKSFWQVQIWWLFLKFLVLLKNKPSVPLKQQTNYIRDIPIGNKFKMTLYLSPVYQLGYRGGGVTPESRCTCDPNRRLARLRTAKSGSRSPSQWQRLKLHFAGMKHPFDESCHRLEWKCHTLLHKMVVFQMIESIRDKDTVRLVENFDFLDD